MTGRSTSPRNVAGAEEPIVYVVDDDASVREALRNLFRSVGLRVAVFGSAPEFLQSKLADVPSCLILDIRLPRVSGLDFQVELAKAGIHIPIIFMTGHGDIPMTVRAMKAGAVDFLTKPFRDQDMLDAVTAAIERDRNSRNEAKILSDLHARFATLTAREQEVMALVTAGLMNKQIAAEIGIAEITVKIHRGNIMTKNGREIAGRSGEDGPGARHTARGAAAVTWRIVGQSASPANLSMIFRALICGALCPSSGLQQEAFCSHSGSTALSNPPVISIIDDDGSVRAATYNLVRSLGYIVHTFASAEEFLRSPHLNDTSCVITDVQMPAMSGLELHAHLLAEGYRRAVHFHHGFLCRGSARASAEGGSELFPDQALRRRKR